MSLPWCITDLRNHPGGSVPTSNACRPASPRASKVESGLTPADAIRYPGAPGVIGSVRTNSFPAGSAVPSNVTRPLAFAPGAVAMTSPETS